MMTNPYIAGASPRIDCLSTTATEMEPRADDT